MSGTEPSAGRRWTLLGHDGLPYRSAAPGTLGGHHRGRIYGLLDCRSALRAIAAGGYVRHRVFVLDESAAVAAGFRPCGACLPDRYARWKVEAEAEAGRVGGAEPLPEPEVDDVYSGHFG